MSTSNALLNLTPAQLRAFAATLANRHPDIAGAIAEAHAADVRPGQRPTLLGPGARTDRTPIARSEPEAGDCSCKTVGFVPSVFSPDGSVYGDSLNDPNDPEVSDFDHIGTPMDLSRTIDHINRAGSPFLLDETLVWGSGIHSVATTLAVGDYVAGFRLSAQVLSDKHIANPKITITTANFMGGSVPASVDRRVTRRVRGAGFTLYVPFAYWQPTLGMPYAQPKYSSERAGVGATNTVSVSGLTADYTLTLTWLTAQSPYIAAFERAAHLAAGVQQ